MLRPGDVAVSQHPDPGIDIQRGLARQIEFLTSAVVAEKMMSMTVNEPTPKQILEGDGATSSIDETGGMSHPGEDLSLLEDKVPAHLQAPRVLAIYTVIFGLGYLLLSLMPVSHTDVWGHIAYGREIVAGRGIPQTEPLLKLAQGVPFVDTAWLSKVTGYLMYNQFGLYGLQFLFALLVTASCAVLTRSIYARSRSLFASLFGAAVFALMAKPQLEIVRPQLAGVLCFSLLLTSISSQRLSRAAWWQIPLLFVIWANSHGSFFVGLVALGAACVGQFVDVARRRSIRAAFRSRTAWHWFLMFELAAVAVFVNPAGIGIYRDVMAIASNPNMRIINEWAPLTFSMWQGKWAFAAALALLLVYRCSPRRVTATEFLLIAGFGGLTLWSSRMMIWWGPVTGLYLGLHLAAILRRWRQTDIWPEPSPRSGKWSVVVLGLAWLSFAFSPFCSTLLHGQKLYLPGDSRTQLSQANADRYGEDPTVGLFRRRVTYYTPIDAANYIREHDEELPAGLIYNGYEWGDYLEFAGIGDRQVFVNSHAHLIPEEVWNDMVVIARGDEDWDDKLDRYGVNLVVIEPDNYVGLKRVLDRSDVWSLKYADPHGVSVIYARRKPITVPGHKAAEGKAVIAPTGEPAGH